MSNNSNNSNNRDKFLNLLESNLKSNGFPVKKVAFDIEKIYEIADKYELSFNALKEDLHNLNIEFETTSEKIIFSKVESREFNNNQDMFDQAQEMLSKMSPEEIQNIQKMYERMSDVEKQDLLKKAQELGLG